MMGILPLFLSLAIGFVAGHEGAGDDHDDHLSYGTSTVETLDTFHIVQDANSSCTEVIHDFNPLLHKEQYRVGVFISEGEELVYDMYEPVFADYLSATAGQRFDPPITFQVVPVHLADAMDMAEEGQLDFLFASSAVFSCMATERQAQALVTIINRRETRGYAYDLDVYGGVMFTLADNEEINDIEDFKDRVIGAGSITAMGGGQTQFYEMFIHGLSYVADPKQVVFTDDERLVVQGVLDGDFEIGFARTDQIERHQNPDGSNLKADTFKIINPQTHVLDSGKLFPFVSSTGLHPEWPLAAMDKTNPLVQREVAEALLAIQEHAAAGQLGQKLRCETTADLTLLAEKARKAGAFTGFRTARSYHEVRTKQEMAGFLTSDNGKQSCIRGDTLYNDIQCPEKYYKVNEEAFETSCQDKGLTCPPEFECFCQPCVKAFEVDVFQYFGDTEENATGNQEGCEKMSLCGEIQQTKMVTFRMLDHLERVDPAVEVIMHWADRDYILDVAPLNDSSSSYEFDWGHHSVGVGIMEIFFDGEQIPESPMRLQVVPRDCDAEFPGLGMVPDSDGDCVCDENSTSIGNKCVPSSTLAIIFSCGILAIILILGLFYMQYRHQKGDEVWKVDVDELHFDQPVEMIGQGSFGVVLKAEYRGTKVAIKRALKSKRKRSGITKIRQKLGSAYASNDMAQSELSNDQSGRHIPDQSARQMTGSGRSSLVNFEESDPNLLSEHGEQGTRSITDINRQGSLGFLDLEFGRQQSKWQKMNPFSGKNLTPEKGGRHSIAFSATESATVITFGQEWCPWFDENARQREEFKREMRILSRLRHPAITTVMGAVVTKTHDPMLVMEYMEYGSLHNLLRNETLHLSGEIVLQMARDLSSGIRFLHGSKPPILHGDLKARNILVDSKFRAKICDFGLSTKKRSGGISGTPYWLPPEYLRGEKEYDTTCDMYSIGIILYELFSRKSPYEGEVFKDVLRGVCNRSENKRPDIPNNAPPKFVNLMKKCWSPDPQFRPRAMDLDMALLEMTSSDAEPEAEDHAEHQKRSGEMLYELFPKHVADQIRRGQKVEPESHELVTIIFSDIIHFTDISRTISPEKVCDMLDRLYHAFDSAARKHKVFKVETIGDAYMGVTNLESDQNDSHVRHIAEFAIDMVNEATKVMIDEEDPTRGNINIRVGFHSGPVVSNVIGSMNKRFGLFGDSVNTASRMESNSTANRILCSERSYRLLKRQAPNMLIKKRGKIQVKGKGPMVTYWVGDDKLTAKKNDAFEKKMRRRSTLEFNFDDDDTTTDIQLETAPLNEKTEKQHNLTRELSLGSKGKETFGMNGVEEKA